MDKKKLGPQILVYPMPAVLVGADVDKKPNFMTAAFCNIMAFKPPALSVGIQKIRYTMKGIETNGTFSVNIPSASLVKEVDRCGLYSGRNKDKSKTFNTFYGVLKTAPLIEECPLNLECRVKHTLDLGSHLLIVGEIVETHITETCLTDGKADPEKIDPLVYIPTIRKYYRLGEFVADAFKVGKEKQTRG